MIALYVSGKARKDRSVGVWPYSWSLIIDWPCNSSNLMDSANAGGKIEVIE